ncbi:DUF4411 family protein [Amantichitinum ursilacus]|uniref:PIN domain protein n=1 Tax=Amantichitinum ursilacus TaxID=857265 RepID=A0A0N0GN03_9NEIS|nr:DUF4411 family protein [Amantichitinum ursilacus]KPC52010.1 hypothetical protein WG78_13150 [Amantichitinum ursilacus]
MPRYLFDSNIFIQAKNFHYHFGYCAAFWDWVAAAHEAGLVFSTQSVRSELLRGDADDVLVRWVHERLPDTFFIDDLRDANVMTHYGAVQQVAIDRNHYQLAALRQFADINYADAFLIAAGRAYGYTVVSFEAGLMQRKNRVMLPDICQLYGVRTEVFWDVLRNHCSGTFVLRVPE